MTQLRLAPLVVAALLAGCGGADAAADRAGQEPPAPSATPAPPPPPEPQPPDPGRPLPGNAERLAADLTATATSLRDGVIAWRRDGDPATGDAPEDVAGLAARAEAIHRTLAPRRRLTAAVLPRLPARVRSEARDVIAARRALAVLNAPRPGQKPFQPRTGPPEPADVLWRYFREGRRRSGVSPALLAAVNLIESDFGRVRNESVAGAQGPMQFMPATWRSYGRGGDIQDPHDAILGAARFLAAAGAARSEAAALFRYNPSALYVTTVARYATVMRRDPLAFYAFYASGAAAP